MVLPFGRMRGALIAGAMAVAAGCDSSAAPFVLEGQYHATSADGGAFPTPQYFPDTTVGYAWIRGAKLEITATDTLWLTTQFETLDASGHVTAILPSDSVFFIYQRVGDSLVFTPSVSGGSVAGSTVHLTVFYPVPPLLSFADGTHRYVFIK